MNSVLKLILEGEHLSSEQMAQVLGMQATEVEAELASLKNDKILLGWRPVLNPDYKGICYRIVFTARLLVDWFGLIFPEGCERKSFVIN